MTSQPESIERVLALLDGLEDVTHRAMMGEYILYYRGKVVGGIYDDRFLLKITPASQRLLSDAARATPYEGAKDMILVEVEDREVLRDVLDAMWEDLPAPKRKK
ncbi:MAG: TfoX/Sxy family protein [Schaalia odontolytica]